MRCLIFLPFAIADTLGVNSPAFESRASAASHVFTGTVAQVITMGSAEYARIQVTSVKKGDFACDCDASVEYDPNFQLAPMELEQSVRCFCDARFKLLPAGFDVLEDAAAVDIPFGAAEVGGVQVRAAEVGGVQVRRVPITNALADEPERKITLNWDEVWAAPDSSAQEQSKLPWTVVRAALEANWLTSSFLRKQRPPTLTHARRHGLSGTVVLTRDVTVQECRWLEKDLTAGERFHVYTGNTFGCISPEGLAVQPLSENDESSPFMELPAVRCASSRDVIACGFVCAVHANACSRLFSFARPQNALRMEADAEVDQVEE